ncbi:MAG: group I intron-associated PD-(D/E)XK endonuclease [Gaiellaceae bacterium]
MSKLTTDHKGAIAEAEIAASAIKLGVGVSKPLSPRRYDLVFDVGTRLMRVQCRWGTRFGSVVVIRCRSCRRGPDGFVYRDYGREEIDAIAAYCADIDCCYFFPVEDFVLRSAIQVRLEPSLNNQRMGVNWAEDFSFEAKLKPLLGP